MYIKHHRFSSFFSFFKSLSQVFGRMKLYKKGSRNIILFYSRKLSRLRGQFCSIALVIDTFYCTNVVLQIDLLIEITFLSKKKYISM